MAASPADPRPVNDHAGGFDAMYAGQPPWDIGRPQAAFVALADAGLIRGRVLDVGCGTGEHVLMCADRGLDATGVDLRTFSSSSITAASVSRPYEWGSCQ